MIFDASGTILDDIYPVWKTNLQILRLISAELDLSAPRLTLKQFRHTFVLPPWKFYVRSGIPASFAKQASSLFESIYPEWKEVVRPFRDADRVLQALCKLSVKLGLVSQIQRQFLNEHLARFRLEKRFLCIVAAEDTCEGKPSAQPVQLAVSRLGLKRSDKVLYIGDMVEDIIAARNAGVMSAAICHRGAYHTKELLASACPDYMLKELRELLNLV